jgi:hypothetical protein
MKSNNSTILQYYIRGAAFYNVQTTKFTPVNHFGAGNNEVARQIISTTRESFKYHYYIIYAMGAA